MKKTTITLIIFATFLHFNILAQEFRPKYGLDIQFAANAPTLGLKLHRNFYLNHDSHITFGTGIGVGTTRYFATLMNDLTYSVGDGRNYLEAGIVGLWTPERFYFNEIAFFKSSIGNGKYIVLPLIGYKFVSPNFSVVRVHFTPLITDQTLCAWGGISIGINFRSIYQEKTNIGTVRFATK
jgi:hypothetical protein